MHLLQRGQHSLIDRYCKQLYMSTGKRRNMAASGQKDGSDGGLIRGGTPVWFQTVFTIEAPNRGFHLITEEVYKQVPQIRNISVGLCHLFIKHTSASLSINENCDPDVRTDMESAFNRIVPEAWNRDVFRHTDEGDDDMPAHVKSTIIGPDVTVPITKGKLALGTWQGIYLCEHRNRGGWGGGHRRAIVATLQGISTE